MGLSDWLFGATPGQQVGQAGGEIVQKGITAIADGLYKIIDQFTTNDQEKLKAKMAVAEWQLEVTKTTIADIQSARQMQVQTKSNMPGFMSTVTVLGFYGGFGMLLWFGLPENIGEFAKTIVTMFAGAMVSEYARSNTFWLGSTNSSQNKDQLIYHSTPTKKEN